jgi:hypothetical protein
MQIHRWLRTLCVLACLAGGVAANEPWDQVDFDQLAEWLGGDVPHPQISVDGPNSAPAGELVRLDAVADPSVGVLWHLVGGADLKWDTSNDGRTVFFASPVPGRYVFTLSAATCPAPGVTPQLQILEHVVTLSGVPPGPGPGPTPGPTPPGPTPPAPPHRPTLPKGRFEISQTIYDGVATMPAGDKAFILQVANNYSTVASRCAAGGCASLDAALKQLQTLNAPLFGGRRDDHLKAWGNALFQKTGQLAQAGKLPSGSDWFALFEETALGLRTWGAN